MKAIIMAACLLPSIVWAGWESWTPAQRTALRNWIAVQNTRDTPILLRRFTAAPVTGYTPTNLVVRPRDPWVVLNEQIITNIAAEAGITKADRDAPKTVNAKLVQWVKDAPTTPVALNRVYLCSGFWDAYRMLRANAVTGAETATVNTGSKPIYGKSPAAAAGIAVADVTGNDIERAQRDKGGTP